LAEPEVSLHTLGNAICLLLTSKSIEIQEKLFYHFIPSERGSFQEILTKEKKDENNVSS